MHLFYTRSDHLDEYMHNSSDDSLPVDLAHEKYKCLIPVNFPLTDLLDTYQTQFLSMLQYRRRLRHRILVAVRGWYNLQQGSGFNSVLSFRSSLMVVSLEMSTEEELINRILVFLSWRRTSNIYICIHPPGRDHRIVQPQHGG